MALESVYEIKEPNKATNSSASVSNGGAGSREEPTYIDKYIDKYSPAHNTACECSTTCTYTALAIKR